VFVNATNTSQNGAGIRYMANHLHVHDVVFRDNEMGIEGGGDDMLVDFCEMAHNGTLLRDGYTHNVYVDGGQFTLRYSYVHDSVAGQNLHLRCSDCRIEYNWIARAHNYEIDLMTTSAATTSQKATFVGNVFIQNATPENGSFFFAMYNDDAASKPDLSME